VRGGKDIQPSILRLIGRGTADRRALFGGAQTNFDFEAGIGMHIMQCTNELVARTRPEVKRKLSAKESSKVRLLRDPTLMPADALHARPGKKVRSRILKECRWGEEPVASFVMCELTRRSVGASNDKNRQKQQSKWFGGDERSIGMSGFATGGGDHLGCPYRFPVN